MSDLTVEATRYEPEDIDWDEALDIMDAAEADFVHWRAMPFWSLDEGIALMLGKDPKIVHWDVIRDYVNYPYSTELCSRYGDLRELAVRALQMKEIEDPTPPWAFLKWANRKGLQLPEQLREPLTTENTETCATCLEMGHQVESLKDALKQKDLEITFLKERILEAEKQITTLEALTWEGFDTTKKTYCKELAIAVQAHASVSKSWKIGSSIKKQIRAWLQAHHPSLSNEQKSYISTLCNWQKKGGAPRTPMVDRKS